MGCFNRSLCDFARLTQAIRKDRELNVMHSIMNCEKKKKKKKWNIFFLLLRDSNS